MCMGTRQTPGEEATGSLSVEYYREMKGFRFYLLRNFA